MAVSGPSKEFRELMKCPVCFCTYSEPVALLPCLHKFCKKCIDKVRRNLRNRRDGALRCPTCRKEVTAYNIDHSFKQLVDHYRKERLEAGEELSEDEEDGCDGGKCPCGCGGQQSASYHDRSRVHYSEHAGRFESEPPSHSPRMNAPASRRGGGEEISGTQIVATAVCAFVGGLIGGIRGATVGGALGAAVFSPSDNPRRPGPDHPS